MKHFVLAAAFWIAAGCTAQTAPTASGVYLKNNGQWMPLSVANASGFRSDGLGRAMLTGGIAGVHGDTLFAGRTAQNLTSEESPVFCIVSSAKMEERDIVIVRLKQKHGQRELQTVTASAYRGASVQYEPKETTHVTASQDGACQTVRPTSPLKPGEYILFASPASISPFPTGYNGYDFSVK